MNQQQRTNCLQLIDNIEQFDIAHLLAKRYPGEDLRTISFADTSAAEFLENSKRMASQFKIELSGSNAKWLPTGYNWDTATQSNAHRQIYDVLNTFWSNFSSENWTEAAQYLELIIGYEILCGFWNKIPKLSVSENRVKQQRLLSDLSLSLEQSKAVIKRAEERDQELNSSIALRKIESEQMTELLAESTRHQQQISTLLNQSSASDGSLQQIVSNQQTNLNETKAQIAHLSEQMLSLDSSLKEAAEKLKESEARLNHMKDKEEWVNKLAGTAAASELGGKFEARKKELRMSSWFWLIGVIVSLVVSGAWLVKAHFWLWHESNLVDSSKIWLVVAVNLGLLAPVIFGVGFMIRQYGKERHYQEEYAFRSSVAMTLSAFADRLVEDKDERNKLIKETIEKLYRLPNLLEAQPSRSFFGPGKAIKDSIQAATEFVKEIKKSD